VNRWDQLGLAERVREIREELYGEHGGQFLADSLKVPLRTWLNYESGVTMPAVLQLIVVVGVNPHWLLIAQGERYYHRSRQY
jgi:hypothetical protein